MMRRAVALAAVLAFGTGSFVGAQRKPNERLRIPPAAEKSIQDAFAAYANGDDLAAERWLSSFMGVTNLTYLELVIERDTTPWQRSTPAFLLEVAAALGGARAPRVPAVLKAGLSRMVSRPTALGADPVADRFELLWHQAALGVAQGVQQYWLQQDLLDVIRLRFDVAGHGGMLAGTRIPLARAMAAGGLCCWKHEPGETYQQVPPSGRRPVSVDQALALFDEAAEIPALRVEALIRAAVLLRKMGRDAEALEWFDRVPTHEDRALGYVHHLTRARLLDGADRTADAVTAYRRALEFEPHSQLATIGLAAALLRSGQPDAAVDAAARARRMPAEVSPEDRIFRRGDARFVPEWLAEIRRLRR